MKHVSPPTLEYAFTIAIELTGARWIKPSNMGMTRAAVYAGSGTIELSLVRGTEERTVLVTFGHDGPPAAQV